MISILLFPHVRSFSLFKSWTIWRSNTSRSLFLQKVPAQASRYYCNHLNYKESLYVKDAVARRFTNGQSKQNSERMADNRDAATTRVIEGSFVSPPMITYRYPIHDPMKQTLTTSFSFICSNRIPLQTNYLKPTTTSHHPNLP